MRRHSAIALVFLAMLAFMAYLRHWQIPWGYYIAATVLYSCTVILALLLMESPSSDERPPMPYLLRSVNFALMTLILLEWVIPTKPAPTIDAVLFFKFIVGIVIGFGLSAAFDIIPQLRNGEIAHGWLGVAVLVYALIVPFAKAWALPWLYYTFIMTIYCGLGVLWVWTPDKQSSPPTPFRDKKVIRYLWGIYLVMLLWVSVLLFDLSNFNWAVFLFVLILAIPVCFALSFLLSILIAEEPAPTPAERKRRTR